MLILWWAGAETYPYDKLLSRDIREPLQGSRELKRNTLFLGTRHLTCRDLHYLVFCKTSQNSCGRTILVSDTLLRG